MAGDVLDNRGRGEVGGAWPAIRPEGWQFGLLLFAAGLLFLALGWSLFGWVLLFASAGVVLFFRDPERVVPQGERLIISPSDGRVVAICRTDPPSDLIENTGISDAQDRRRVTRLSIAVSLPDVHMNRAPMSGTVRRVFDEADRITGGGWEEEDAGKRRQILLSGRDGATIVMTQATGPLARRKEAFVKRGDTVAAGQRLGMVRLGSRVDVYLPRRTDPLVILGQRVIAGETVIARLGTEQLIEGRRQ